MNNGGSVGSKERIEREKEQRREKIIRAAEKLILKKGPEGATMEEIARKCELSKGALYLYFATKEQLFHVIVLRAMTEMHDLMKKMQEGTLSHIDRLRMIGEAYFKFYETHPDHFRILAKAIDHDHDHMHEINDGEVEKIRKKHNEIWGLITSIIRDGVNDGTFLEDTDPIEIGISLYAVTTMIIQLMDQYNRNKDRIPEEEENVLGKIDFRKIFSNNGRRIVFSILKNPPEPE